MDNSSSTSSVHAQRDPNSPSLGDILATVFETSNENSSFSGNLFVVYLLLSIRMSDWNFQMLFLVRYGSILCEHGWVSFPVIKQYKNRKWEFIIYLKKFVIFIINGIGLPRFTWTNCLYATDKLSTTFKITEREIWKDFIYDVGGLIVRALLLDQKEATNVNIPEPIQCQSRFFCIYFISCYALNLLELRFDLIWMWMDY